MTITLEQQVKRYQRRIKVWVARRLASDQGATTLEWALLLAAIAIPSMVIIALSMRTLTAHYRMMSLLNSLPFP